MLFFYYYLKHPLGFHGHNRAKSRIEFSNFYRQLAKPTPPQKFVSRQNSDVLRHSFSHHDNRQAYLNDPNLFGDGFGKKKIDSVNKSKWKPDFISWQDSANLNLVRNQLTRSIYQRDFASTQELRASMPQPPQSAAAATSRLLTGREAFDNNKMSVYKLNYSHGEPTKSHSKEIQEETYYRFINKNRAKSCMMNDETRRTTVASCLVWNDRRQQVMNHPGQNQQQLTQTNQSIQQTQQPLPVKREPTVFLPSTPPVSVAIEKLQLSTN